MYDIVGTGTVLTSCVAFWLFNKFLDDNSEPVKVPEKYSGYTKCKWRNVMGSILHAVLVSMVGFYCVFRSPEYMSERVTTHTTLGEVNICITIGYLVYDASDLMRFQGVYSTWPILTHHCCLFLLGFGCIMYHQQLVAYALMGSMIETNSIFLHGRQLLLMYGFSKDSLIYKINNAFNIFTYITFRLIGGSIMLLVFLPADYDKMSSFWFVVFTLAILTLVVINMILFYRLIRSDFIAKDYRSSNIMLSPKQAEKTAIKET
ncbi:TLC domain-containing protein 2-like [Amphiura filiformis]|uniref:TLC domain-containing protein 2-like n=1 Tax=Amphiura filiformis TaxID=82378 RepID=UPI003B224B77